MKNNSRTKNATRNIVWGVMNKGISIFLPFLVRTVMIYKMGLQYVGLGSLFSAILQVLSFAELGVGSALVFSMYEPMERGNEEKINALLNYYRKAYRIIGGVILAIGMILLPFLKYLIKGEAPSEINLYYLFGIYLLNNVLGYFLYAYKQSLFMASQRVDRVSVINSLTQVLMCLLQIISLLVLGNYYVYAAIIPIVPSHLYCG